MTAAPRQSTEADIDALDAVCQRLAGFGVSLSVEYVDGWLTALACTARRVPRDEWLALLTEGCFARAYADPDDAAPALAAFDARLEVLADQLQPEALYAAPDDLRLAPLMIEWDDAMRREEVASGAIAAGDADHWLRTGLLWAEGFRDATEALASDWPMPDLGTDDGVFHANCLAQVLALHVAPAALADYLAAQYPGQTLTRDDLVDEACFAAQELRLFWHERSLTPAPRHVAPQPGRNDPCPCGSGRKFKKCHGAA